MTPLDAYIRQDGIRYFTAAELVQPHKGVPAQALWPNILGALRIADAIRVAYGAPVRVVSGFRSREYNAKVGGSKKSMHMEFRALDLAPANGDIEGLRPFAEAAVFAARKAGVNVGFGQYDTFVHIDTGAPTGRNRSWDERGNKGAGR